MKLFEIKKISDLIAKPHLIVLLAIWTFLVLYPAYWHLNLNQERYNRYHYWSGYRMFNDLHVIFPYMELYHYFKYPNHNAIVNNSQPKLNFTQTNPINQLDCFDHSCLGYAAAMGDDSTVEKLISNNADLNQQQFFGLTPLHLAIMHHRKKVLPHLLKAKAKTDIPDNNHQTALHLAVKYKSYSVISNSDSATTNFEIVDKNGLTPLQTAIYKKNIKAVIELAIAGASFEHNIQISDYHIRVFIDLWKNSGDPVAAAGIFAEKNFLTNPQKNDSTMPAEYPIDLNHSRHKKRR
jgi:ankyrin repeat protein